MYNVFKVVNWLRVRNSADLRTDPNAEELTQMKAMKLLYYIQAANLVITNHRMFDNDIVAWKYGPVVEEVHKKYRGRRGIVKPLDKQAIRDYRELQKDSEASVILNSIYDTYGKSSAYDLLLQIYKERPWQKTSQNYVIDDKLIRDYYKQVFKVKK